MLKKLCLFKIIILTLRHNSKVKPRLSGTQNHQRFYLQHKMISIMARTDVTLFNPNTQEELILDAKFYREALVSKFGGREKVRRDHLSQILSYVMNQEDRSKPHTMNACGALVYPTVDEDFDFSYRYKETGHRIFVRRVNLGQPWRKIEERVKEIVKGEGRDEW